MVSGPLVRTAIRATRVTNLARRVGGALGGIARGQYAKYKPQIKAKIEGRVTHYLDKVKGHFSKMGNEMVHVLTEGAGMKMPMSKGVVGSSAAGAITNTKYSSKLLGRPSKIYQKMMNQAQRLEYVTNSKFRASTLAGVQTPYDFSSCANSSGYSAVSTGLQGLSIYGGTGYSATAQLQGALGAIALQFTGTDVNGTNTIGSTRVYHKYCHVDTEIVNLSQYPVEVDIYECVAKHDLQGISGSPPGNQLPYNGVMSPALAWIAGMLNTSSTTNVVIAGTPGAYPYDSELFNVYWKVCSQHKVEMGIGGIHRHISHYQMDRFVDSQRVINSGILAGITRNIMFVVRGTPVRDTLNSGLISYGPAGLNILSTHTYVAEAIPYSIKKSLVVKTSNEVAIGETTVFSTPTTDSTLNTI